MRVEGKTPVDETLYLSKRLAYSGGDLAYVGFNTIINASTTATDWQIYKYTWSSGDLTYMQGPLIGSWDGRAALGWT